MSLALKVALGPVLLWQGRRVRQTALRLPEAAGSRAGVAGEGEPALRLLVVGDSAAAGVGVDSQVQALAGPLAEALAQSLGHAVGWQLVATTGHGAADALQALREHPALQPADVMVTSLGVNDVLGQVAPRQWLAHLDALVALAAERCGVQRCWHSAVPPMGRFPLLPHPLRWVLGQDAARLDGVLRRQVGPLPHRFHVPLPVAPAGAAFADWMARDGFHPGPAGYRAWSAGLAAQMVADGLGLPGSVAGGGTALPASGVAPRPQLGQ